MPDLGTQLHLDMLAQAKEKGLFDGSNIYGLQWGDPQEMPRLRDLRDRFVLPYVHPDKVAIEIGSGGGRWTRYLLGFGTVYSFDYYQELLDELARTFRAPHLILTKNSGSDFPGIDDQSVDYVFSFGVFVHLDMPIIRAYLAEIRRVLKADGCAVLQYSDMRKPEAQGLRPHFSENTPEQMRSEVKKAGLTILEEDLESLPNAAVIRFKR